VTRLHSWAVLAAVRRLIDDGPGGAFPRLERLQTYLIHRLTREG
jgi:hypothetical protein